MIKDKKDGIIMEVMSEFEAEHKGYHSPTQHSKCIRDTGFNFDAIISDLEKGGIKNVLEIAERYWHGTKSNLGKGEQNYAVQVNNLLEQRLHKEEGIDKTKVSLLIGIINEVVQFGLVDEDIGMDIEDNIRYMFYDWDNERKVMLQMQKCQRNYDYSRWTDHPIYNEYINELLWTATNSPTKQHEGYFDIHWTADRKLIQELSRYTWGYTHRRNPPATWRNSQSNGSVYFVWVAKEPNSQLNSNADGTLKSNTDKNRWQNAYASIGISLGLTMRAANKMGFATGANKSHNDLNGDDYWPKKLGIFEDVKAGKKEICYGLAVGYPQKDRPRWESDEEEILIGAANGSKITTTGQETHPRTGKKMRRGKIVNIKEHGGKYVSDPYGYAHLIPKKAEFKINSNRQRGIEIRKII